MIKIGIVGGTGYTGVELLRLLATHPQAEIVQITSRAEAGRQVSDLYGNLRGRTRQGLAGVTKTVFRIGTARTRQLLKRSDEATRPMGWSEAHGMERQHSSECGNRKWTEHSRQDLGIEGSRDLGIWGSIQRFGSLGIQGL